MPKGKIITTLRDRPEIESALDALARARTEPETQAPLDDLARFGAAVLPVVVSHLDTPDPWMVRALGRALAQLPNRQLAAEALRRAILDPASADRRRIVAMVLLDQFLEQPLDEGLFAALGSPAEVSAHALMRELPDAERLVRLDYLSIIHVQQPPDIQAALDRFCENGSDPAIAALGFFALDEREAIGVAAVELLGTIRRPAALRTLRIVEANVPSSRRALVERMQRKLFLSGVPDEPLPEPPPGARVLISPLDGAGNRLMLFLFPGDAGYRGLHVFLDDEQGVRGAYELDYAPAELPRPAAVGAVHPAPHPWKGVLLLEGTWGYARRLLREALPRNEAQETFCPVEYRFFCDRVWGWSVPPDQAPAVPGGSAPNGPEAIFALVTAPYLASWFVESEAIYRAALGLLSADLNHPAGQEQWGRAIFSLLDSECTPEWCERFAGRLCDMAEWLVRAGEARWAAAAAAAQGELERTGPVSLFARAMVQKGLHVALDGLRQGV